LTKGRFCFALVVAALAVAACDPGPRARAVAAAAVSSGTPAPEGATLYRRLGGYDAIAAVTDDFLARLLGDPKMTPYFENVDEAGTRRIRQMIVDQLCAASGGPCLYAGSDMATAHKDLQISERAFDVAAGYFGESLDKFKVPSAEKNELIRIVAGTKADVVGK
jgi:hemoglobin